MATRCQQVANSPPQKKTKNKKTYLDPESDMHSAEEPPLQPKGPRQASTAPSKMYPGQGSGNQEPNRSISRPPPTARIELPCRRELNSHFGMGLHFGVILGGILEPSWPTILTLALSGPILAPFGRSSLRCKSGWAKTAVLEGLLWEGSAAEGRPPEP